MKKILPILFILIGAIFIVALFPRVARAQATTGSNGQQTVTTTDSSALDGKWVQDQEVTFVGKMASRSEDFLDWTLQNYNWACVTKVNSQNCDNSNNPLSAFYAIIRNIVYVFLILFVLVSAFIIIITRGQNLTVMKFIPRFVVVIVLVTFAYSLVQIIYTSADIVQGCFMRLDCKTAASPVIDSTNLLHIAFDYTHFLGYRRIGPSYEESAFISLLLVRLTAYTYYVMSFILIIRKIILWFFIIISAIFPLLLFYNPIRNTAKLWIGEFFRWLLYAPLFAIFLHGLVVMWQAATPAKSGIPLAFDFAKVGGDPTYPTAINILLGGPGQAVAMANSVNIKDTFALYVVSLLMLWVVILLPFLLLNIFLDYLKSISIADTGLFKGIAARSRGFLHPPSPVAPPVLPQGAGMARSLPFRNAAGSQVRTIPVQATNSNFTDVRAATEIMKLTNLSIPHMRDIAKYESSLLSRDTTRTQEVSHVSSTLQKIANPTLASNPAERERFETVRGKLMQQKQKGDPMASSILSASTIATQKTTTGMAVGKQLQQMGTTAHLPVVNKVQQVSLEEYEEVRKMWEENYKNLEVPKSVTGGEMNRKQWVENDINKINQAISLLTAADTQRNREGMDMVANILPFLLIGGFSRTEVIAYLKAKLEAAKSTLGEVKKKDEEEDSLLDTKQKHTEAQKEMTAEEEIPEDKAPKDASKELEESPVFKEPEKK